LNDFSNKSDVLFKQALHAIANVEFRSWPDGVALYNFHESFESDIKRVKAFCRNKRIFGRGTQALLNNHDTISYLAAPICLYYLPAILLVVLQHPRSQLAIAMLQRFTRDKSLFTPAEDAAVEFVIAFLMTKGVSRDALLKSVEEGRAIYMAHKDSLREVET